MPKWDDGCARAKVVEVIRPPLQHRSPLLDELGRTLTKPYVAQRLGESDRGTFLRLVEQQARLTPITEVVTGVW